MPRAASSAGFDFYLQPFTDPEPEYYGSTMIFHQATAPTGWTQDTSENDIGLRIVSGTTGGTVSGTRSFTSVYPASGFPVQVSVATAPIAPTDTGFTSIGTAGLPIHTHSPTVTSNTVPGASNPLVYGTASVPGTRPVLAYGWYYGRESAGTTFPATPPGYPAPAASHNHTWPGAAGGGFFTATSPSGFSIRRLDFIRATKNFA